MEGQARPEEEPGGEPEDVGEAPESSEDERLAELLDRWARGEALEPEELERVEGLDEAAQARLALVEQLAAISALFELPASDELPERIGRYRVLGELEVGGQAHVFRALDTRFQVEVALKVLSAGAADGEQALEWTLDEARSLARIVHDSVVRVRDVDVAEGLPFLVMDLVEGPTLAQAIAALRAPRAEDSPAAAEAAAELAGLGARSRLVLRLARALDACHRGGVLHRDVKPANVLLDAALCPKLIDFGLARRREVEREALRAKERYGTEAYLAPELRARGNQDATAASDQYALGVVLHELLTMSLPLARDGREAWRAAPDAPLRSPRALRRDIPGDLERICLHALERKPEDRYPSLGALADDLEAFLDHRAISLEEPGPARRVWLAVRRRPLHAALVGVGAALALLLAAHLALEASQRARLLADVERRLEDALASERPHDALLLFFSELRDARVWSRRSEAGLVSGLLLQDSQPTLDALWRRASELLHARMAAAFDAARKGKVPREDDERFEAVAATWRGAATLESLTAPGGVCDAPHHRLGTVELPAGAKLLRLEPRGPVPEFEPADPSTALRPGVYRVAGRSAEGPWELDIDGLAYTPRRRIEEPSPLFERRAGLADRLVPHPGGEILIRRASAAGEALEESYAVGRVRISSTPANWRDLELGLGASRMSTERAMSTVVYKRDPNTVQDTDPALLTALWAQECARSLGARLPTMGELFTALRSGLVQPVEGCTGEWVSNWSPQRPEQRAILQYPKPGEELGEYPLLGYALEKEWPGSAPTAFRFVVPVD